jgi:predicted ester cyclase
VSVEQNKAAIRRFVAEVRNRGNVDVLDELAAPAVREEMKAVARGLRAAFDSYEVEVVDLVGEGDTVVLRGIQRGVHRGEWLGVPPTGRSVTWMVLRMFKFGADGQIVQTWAFSDTRDLLQQMGARITPA